MFSKPLLVVEALSLNREGRQILQDVNLRVFPGQVHALLGVNGSGKSSLAYALMGCSGYEPDAGRILFQGEDITNMPIDQRARLGITLAWQEPARFEGLPIGKYLSLGMDKANQDGTREALDAVNLPPRAYLRRRVDDTLSGGERKRVELAAVFAMHPRLAILDEPDSGIDTLSLTDIGELVRQMAENGAGVLIITHRDEMAAVAYSASLMCLGTIVFSGKPKDVQSFYQSRCQPHQVALGTQPWQTPSLAIRPPADVLDSPSGDGSASEAATQEGLP